MNIDYNLLLGDMIAIGGSRKVFENINDPTTVIKVLKTNKEKNKLLSANKIEWNIWNKYRDTEIEKYLCPCISISDDTVYLIQKKAKLIEPGKHHKRSNQIWKLLPDDIKNLPDSMWYKNWGILDNRYVIIDYGRNNFKRINDR